MLEKMMEWGVTLEDLLKEAEVTEEELWEE
jgi:predicted ATP-grasp superfamily ATP-dependent carboligase